MKFNQNLLRRTLSIFNEKMTRGVISLIAFIFFAAVLVMSPSPKLGDSFAAEVNLKQTTSRPQWYSKLEKYLNDTNSFAIRAGVAKLTDYQEVRDARLRQITKIVSLDKKGGDADLILYYENMAAALSLLVEGNNHAAFAYKAKAIRHLDAAVDLGLIEAHIELARLKIDGLFYEHDIYGGLQSLVSLAPYHELAYYLLYEVSAYDDYFTIEQRRKLETPRRALHWTNEILEHYAIESTMRQHNLRGRYGYQLFTTRFYPLDPSPAYLNDFYNGKVFARCMMFHLAEAEGLQTDAFQKMKRCAGNYYENYKYFLPGLRQGIKAGQHHYLSDLGIALLFDDDTANDNEGVEYLKLGVSYGYYGQYRLAQYYNFVTQEIDKCTAIYEEMPIDWKIEPTLTADVLNPEEDFLDVAFFLPAGCFENIARINRKKIAVAKDDYGTRFTLRFRVKKSDFKDPEKCIEFVNARLQFHPDFSMLGSVTGTKQIAKCED